MINNFDNYRTWKHRSDPFQDDMDQYYSYLPAKFIYKDLTFNFVDSVAKSNSGTHHDRYWFDTLKKERDELQAPVISKGTP